MTGIWTPGFNGLEDESMGDGDEEVLAALRETYLKEKIILRPAEPRDWPHIENLYWRHWMSLRTGIPADRFRPPGRTSQSDVAWHNRMWKFRQPLMDELVTLTGNGLGSVAERDDEILGFLLAKASHWRVLEGTDLFVVPNARNLGIAGALIKLTQGIAAAKGFLTFIGTNSPHYFEGKSQDAARGYLKLSAIGWGITPHLGSALFEFPVAQLWDNRYRDQGSPEKGSHYQFACPWGERPRVDMADERDAHLIASMSEVIPGVQPLTKQQVNVLLQQGPACITTGKSVFGYALSKMGIPGVLEIVALSLNSTASSGETEAEMLTFLHKRGRAYNLDIAMLVDSGGPRPPYTPTFRQVFPELGYIEHLRLGAGGCLPVLARAIWHSEPERSGPPKRFSLVGERLDRSQDEYWGDQKPGGFKYLHDPGESLGRNPETIEFQGARPLCLADLDEPSGDSRLSIVLPAKSPLLFDL